MLSKTLWGLLRGNMAIDDILPHVLIRYVESRLDVAADDFAGLVTCTSSHQSSTMRYREHYRPTAASVRLILGRRVTLILAATT